jgi:hypothetical protein
MRKFVLALVLFVSTSAVVSAGPWTCSKGACDSFLGKHQQFNRPGSGILKSTDAGKTWQYKTWQHKQHVQPKGFVTTNVQPYRRKPGRASFSNIVLKRG